MIVCAALKLEKKYSEPLFIPCIRHSWGYSLLVHLGINEKDYIITEGFLDNKNQFWDRKQALCQLDPHQLAYKTTCYKIENNENELYSEDLY